MISALVRCGGLLTNGYSLVVGERIGAVFASMRLETAIAWRAIDLRKWDPTDQIRGVAHHGTLVQQDSDGTWHHLSAVTEQFLREGLSRPWRIPSLEDLLQLGPEFTDGEVGHLIPGFFHNRYWLPRSDQASTLTLSIPTQRDNHSGDRSGAQFTG